MSQYQIALVLGSLATTVPRLASKDFSINSLKIDDLPLYNQDVDWVKQHAH